MHSMPLWGMRYKSIQNAAIKQFGIIETIEDHLADGGFGSWMMEAMIGQRELLPRLRLHALGAQACGTVGSQQRLHALGGLASGL